MLQEFGEGLALVFGWCAVLAVISAQPGLFIARRGRGRLGWILASVSVGPLLLWAGLFYLDVLRIDKEYPPDALAREAPWGGMFGIWLAIPLFHAVVTTVVSGAILLATVLVDLQRDRIHP